MRAEPIWFEAFLVALRRTGGNYSIACDRTPIDRRNFYRILNRRADLRARVLEVELEIRSERVKKVIRSTAFEQA